MKNNNAGYLGTQADLDSSQTAPSRKVDSHLSRETSRQQSSWAFGSSLRQTLSMLSQQPPLSRHESAGWKYQAPPATNKAIGIAQNIQKITFFIWLNNIKRSLAGLAIVFSTTLYSSTSKADLWGADLPLLAEIVFNTLHTMMELEKQSQHMNDELAGIKDRINRIRTISGAVQPSQWEKWKDPREAVNRLRIIYHAMPKEYRSEKYDTIEDEIAKAMNLAARVAPESKSSFESGKELERRGADASPGVAQKLTASGVGSLISLESQSLTMQSHVITLLAQMLADGNEKETRAVTVRGNSMKAFSSNLSQSGDSTFSRIVLKAGSTR